MKQTLIIDARIPQELLPNNNPRWYDRYKEGPVKD